MGGANLKAWRDRGKSVLHRHDLRKYSPQARIGQYCKGKPSSRGILPHGEERQCDACKLDVNVFFLGIARDYFILGTKPDHEPYNGRGQERHFEDAVAAPFDLSQDRRVAAGDQAAA
jgi:hypothetical protein